MSETRTPMDRRIRISALLVILGLLVEAASLLRNTPGSFILFSTVAIGLVLLGVALFLVSLVTVKS